MCYCGTRIPLAPLPVTCFACKRVIESLNVHTYQPIFARVLPTMSEAQPKAPDFSGSWSKPGDKPFPYREPERNRSEMDEMYTQHDELARMARGQGG